MINFAGPIGTGIARGRIPYSNPGEARLFITKARGEDLGDCDRCNAARTLLRYNPEASDDELIEKWRERWEMAVEILDTPTARCTLGRLASALQEKKHLSSDEVHQVIGDATDTIDWAYIFEKQSK
jgi:hypothetical protein